jgi:peptidoglycan hydrolase-like protein with peptidoglycan-binding domain
MHRFKFVLVLLAAITLVAVSCSDDDDDDSSSATADSSDSSDSGDSKDHSEASAEELEIWQTDLNAVGCYVGAVDGSLGPQTEAAIEAYQAAAGLTVDGKLGPETEAALQDSVTAGTIICVSTTEGGTDGSETAALSSANYDKSFALGSCSLNADVSNVSIQGEADGLTILVEATEGTGTLAVSGGTESDGITLDGAVATVEISDDRSFTVSGAFNDSSNNAGESFTLTGSCPE